MPLALQPVSGCSGFLTFKYADNTCSWFSSMWVAAVACWLSSMLTCLFLALQLVSGCCGLLCFKHADNACPSLSSVLVAAVAFCVSSLLIMSVLGPPGCEWLQWLSVFQACWQCLSLALQDVCGCCGLLCFKHTDNACPWLFRKQVAAVACLCFKHADNAYPWLSRLSVVLWLAVFQACWQCLSLAFQFVSGWCDLLCFKLADNACLWLSSGWVAGMACCVSKLLTMPALAFQRVSGCCGVLCFKPADNHCSWFFRMWVADMVCCVSSMLLTIPDLGSLVSE